MATNLTDLTREILDIERFVALHETYPSDMSDAAREMIADNFATFADCVARRGASLAGNSREV